MSAADGFRSFCGRRQCLPVAERNSQYQTLQYQRNAEHSHDIADHPASHLLITLPIHSHLKHFETRLLVLKKISLNKTAVIYSTRPWESQARGFGHNDTRAMALQMDHRAPSIVWQLRSYISCIPKYCLIPHGQVLSFFTSIFSL